MTYAIRKDTLAGIKQSVLFEPRKVEVLLSATVAKLNSYMESADGSTRPENEALKFYFGNHVFSLIAGKFHQHEPLPEDAYLLARDYVKLSSDIVVRLAYYTLLIITREARHFPGPSSVYLSIKKECGAKVADFCKGLTGHGEHSAVSLLRQSPPETSLDKYVRAMSKIFHEGGWGGAYGGPKWGYISDTLYKLVTGQFSPEMFADTAFTLVHNGGPMFNKGMLFAHWDKLLPKILDVQRSGQIPQLVCDLRGKWSLPRELSGYVAEAQKLFPELVGYVDWYKVEALGAKLKYPKEKQEQLAVHGLSDWAEKGEKLAAEAALKKAKEEASKFYVGPGHNDYAVIVERKAA